MEFAKLLIQLLDFGGVFLAWRILQVVPLDHQISGHGLNVQPIRQRSNKSNTCASELARLVVLVLNQCCKTRLQKRRTQHSLQADAIDCAVRSSPRVMLCVLAIPPGTPNARVPICRTPAAMATAKYCGNSFACASN